MAAAAGTASAETASAVMARHYIGPGCAYPGGTFQNPAYPDGIKAGQAYPNGIRDGAAYPDGRIQGLAYPDHLFSIDGDAVSVLFLLDESGDQLLDESGDPLLEG